MSRHELPKLNTDFPRTDSLQSNLSGPMSGSPIQANWHESSCTPDDPGYNTTGQIKWVHFDSRRYYPESLQHRSTSGVRWSSCRLIAQDLILTAGHTFAVTKAEDPSDNYVTPFFNDPDKHNWPSYNARMMSVRFRYRHTGCSSSSPLDQEVEFRITQLVEYKLGGYDYAIARIEGDATPYTGGIARLSLEPLRIGAAISMVHHPAGNAAKYSPGNIIKALSINGQVMIEHDADTLGGSSGAGPDGQLGQIGVHIAGKCSSSRSIDPCGKRGNVLIPISSIINHSPIIQQLLRQCKYAREKMLTDARWRNLILTPDELKQLTAFTHTAAIGPAMNGALAGLAFTFLFARLSIEAACPKLSEAEKMKLSAVASLCGGGAAGIFNYNRARNKATAEYLADEAKDREGDLDNLHISRTSTSWRATYSLSR